MRYLFVLLCLLLFSCEEKRQRLTEPRDALTFLDAGHVLKESEHKLTLSDLKFPDPEKDEIIRNHVQCITGLDSSTYNYYPPTILSGIIINSFNDTLESYEGREIEKFDRSGNLIFHISAGQREYMRRPWIEKFTFDCLDYNVTHYCVTTEFGGPQGSFDTICYSLVPCKNVLKTSYKIKVQLFWPHYCDSSYSYFDSAGKLLATISYPNKRADTTIYFYAKDGKLQTIKQRNQTDSYCHHCLKATTQYGYKKGLLNSKKILSFYEDGCVSNDDYYYDENGIIRTSYLDDAYFQIDGYGNEHVHFDTANLRPKFNYNRRLRYKVMYSYKRFDGTKSVQ
ncbi:hypothetical protein CJD36_016210 [Flavipsychrobacter stenotrophus]|uniref:Uncharacterized protein n=1 Tax=Flavipsychrobacter stenotrophus TaxID=2077091 RepID=A0A2S7SUD5_9BACT|nr:hypothetical protein [Flavipsychrobacter stenotrophus]PQJ10231.1 hypothetical protein CJD36_016210 [Flavipsychrobacter stenotrophus]